MLKRSDLALNFFPRLNCTATLLSRQHSKDLNSDLGPRYVGKCQRDALCIGDMAHSAILDPTEEVAVLCTGE
jgi:hypothetical protein